MSIIRINQLPEGSGNLTNDDLLIFMDDPSGNKTTKKISLSQLSAFIGVSGGGGGGNPFDQDLNTYDSPTFNTLLVSGHPLNFGQNIDKLGPPVAGGGTDRIRLWDFEGEGSNFNYAIGAEGNHVWFAMDVNNGTGGFKFYSRDNEIFKISDDSKLVFPNGTTVSQGTFDNSTGGGSGISLNCYIGYELNWQGGHLKSTQDNGISAANIWCDSAIEFPGSGIDNVEINNIGITFADGTTQITAATSGLWSKNYGSFYDTTTQTNVSVTGVNTMTFNTTDISQNISMVDGSKLTFYRSGVYNIQFSAQIDKTDGGDDAIDIWLDKNGNPLDWTNTRMSLHAQDAKAVAAWNFVIPMSSGDYLQFKWYSNDIDLRILAQSGLVNPTRPNIPSVILTAIEI